jgi:hypothetical protein
MKKPLNKVAMAMWLMGSAIFLLWAWALLNFIDVLRTSPTPHATSFSGYVLGAVAAAILIALGTIIELVDQIRWNALPPEQRNRH